MPAQLAYLATGRPDVRSQALYAAYSALAWRGDASVTIRLFTDDPAAFSPLAGHVEIEQLSGERLARWREPFDFVFRMKPKLVEHLLERFPGDKVVLVDADTFFVGPVAAPLERIGAGRAALHDREYRLVDADGRPQFHPRFCARLRRARFRGAPVRLDAWMWNSGVVGLDPSHAGIVAEWLRFLDEVYPAAPRPLVEQYGLSLLLQERRDEIHSVADVVRHYYADKRRHHAAIVAELDVLASLPLEDALDRVRRSPAAVSGPAPREPKPPRVERWRQTVGIRWSVLRGLLRRGLRPLGSSRRDAAARAAAG